MPQELIDELFKMFEGFFTEEQVKGTLESYKKLEDGKEQAIANLQSRK